MFWPTLASADCTSSTVSGTTTVTCTGANITDANGGISYKNDPVDILNVNSILDNITPDSGIDGVSLTGDGGSGGNGGNDIGRGGHGDNGGAGLAVVISYDGTPYSIVTSGSNGRGIVATSKGGRGGDGGTGEDDALDPFATFGGNGGNGGNASDVTVTSNGDIEASGQYAHGILAVSEAGDGGHGGHAQGAIDSNGGNGGKGGSSGKVTVDNSGDISTGGDKALGIYAQSVGGSGGDGGSADGLAGSGGSSNGPGPADRVTVTNSGIINTDNDDSTGILAQSIGGFDGNGGSSGGLFTWGANDQSYGDAGDTVTVNNSGAITTDGVSAAAIRAQSIGGGGGSAGTEVGLVAIGGTGSAGGDGGIVNVTNTAVLTTDQDFSDGIHAQSIGGGGGSSGTSVGLLAIGGDGGKGGSGSTVTLANEASISTAGDHSMGILAQSIGKGGGKGGNAVAVGFELSVAVGGAGGSGGNGGEVDLNSLVDQSSAPTTISTQGDHSGGVVAQSVGGGGGHGGWAVSASAGYGFDLSVGKGGDGGTGGDSNSVTLHNNGIVSTVGNYSDGILAQSTAGGGGKGGFDVTVDLSTSVSIGVGVGGGGGDGGDAGTVELASWTDVSTQGDHSAGVMAQSGGGSGGHGGFSIVAGGAGDMTINVSVAGAGGSGGDADTVMLSSTGDITTAGDHSSAVFGQSTGGGGGNGGFSISVSGSGSASIPVSVGGGGGDGGAANAVTVNSVGTLTTAGNSSYGLSAQSVGGGGGNGGFSISVAGSNGLDVPVTVGGDGSSGGSAGAVVATSSGNISTVGNNAHGIFAQSVGGSGGSGGFSISGSVTGSDGVAFPVSVGGKGGIGDTGSTVTVSSAGDVQTSGEHSDAVFAQSLGGGGGHGGFSIEAGFVFGGDGGNIGVSVGGKGESAANADVVQVTSTGDLQTGGSSSAGIRAQSIGGNGGNGGFSVAFNAATQSEIGVSVGGGAGSGGDGKNVSVDSTGNIVTTGKLSYGILAQSVGGGGGNGGFSIAGSLTISGGDDTTADVDVSVGGGAGNGGTAGEVTVTQAGSMATVGGGAHAIFAQSLGGGGGAGGFSGTVEMAFMGDAQIGVSVGGGGGNAASANNVTVTSTGVEIVTLGKGAIGVFAQSVGGSGGDGGFSFVGNITGGTGDGPTTNIGVSVGGGGGNGGKSGVVTVTNSIDVATLGEESYGIQAQSLGGSGGNGGMAVSGDVNLTVNTPSNNLNVAVGGGGGSGNVAGAVVVDNDGGIYTEGGKARAIFAQSIGGDGGNGGLSFSGSLAGGPGGDNGDKNIDVSVGGAGGTGNSAGTVMVTNDGNLETRGYQAQGIYAQSVGGSGGTGGLAGAAVLSPTGKGTNLNVNVAVGGDGGGGSVGKSATVINNGSIVTHGVGSTGIIAQSVGGNGGIGGSSFTGIVGFTVPGSESDDARNLKINVSVGGDGGDAAKAGAVTVTNSGAITTLDGSAKGIFAQSLGGSGGTGGASDTFSMQVGKCGLCSAPDLAEKSMSLSVAVGGSGGTSGDGSTVTVDNASGANIQTSGAGSDAIYAQSIGAGGGEGGNGAIGLGSLIGIPGTVLDDLVVIADPPIQFWKEISVQVGGKGGAAGKGGAVMVTNAAQLVTTGNTSSGIYAQSVGGGGGEGGNSVGGEFSLLNIGGDEGAAGDGDTVTVDNSGNISTGATTVVDGNTIVTGDSSWGIFAQSLGGGGGVAGSVNQQFFGTNANFGIGIGIAFGGGNGGNGAAVNVTNSGTIITVGEAAHAIFAQSTGGGGGLAGEAGESVTGLNFAGTSGDDGDGSTVKVVHTGDILTAGAGAAGIVAQSASGGEDGNTGVLNDGHADGALGIGGAVSVSVNSSVVTTGEHSKAIVAQSVGVNGNGDITIDIGTGSIIVGGTNMDGFGTDNDALGVYLLDGKTNLIDNAGLISSQEGVSGIAVQTLRSQKAAGYVETTEIDTTINNTGTIAGSMFLAVNSATDDTNTVNNMVTGLLNLGTTIDLGGSPNTLTNKGVVSPGGVNNILTTDVNGDFVQTGDGAYVVTVDYADNDPNPGNLNEADLINVSGEADLDGFVIVDAINGAFVGPDQSGSVLILTSTDGFDDPTLVAPDTEVVTYDITYDDTPSGNKVYLNWIVDFTPDGLNRNETAVANYIIEAIDVGDPLAISPVINSLLEAETLDDLRNDYDRLTPEPYIDNEIATVLSNMRLGRTLMDCSRPDEESDRDKGCVWLHGGAYQAEQSESFEYLGFDEFAYEVQGGIGGNISDTAGVVLGFSYSNSQIDTKGRFGTSDIASSTGHRYQGGVGLSNTINGSTFAIAALGGAALYDVERNVDLTDFSATAEGDQNIYFGGGQIRLAHEAKSGAFRFAPMLDTWGGYFYQDAVSESGADGANLDIESSEDYFLAIRPALTLALEFTSEEGNVFRPFVTGGATYFALGNDGDGPSLTATMQGEENAVPGFTVSSALQQYYIDAMAGFEIKTQGGAALRISGSAQYAEDYLLYGGEAKFVAPF